MSFIAHSIYQPLKLGDSESETKLTVDLSINKLFLDTCRKG